MRSNTVLDAWRRGAPTVGGWLSIGNAYSAELMAHLGFDWLCLDLQHGLIGYEDLKVMLPAISTTSTMPFVRVPWNAPEQIMKVLDAGAMGVVVPLVNDREEAERAVAACRYPPDGMRSFGPVRAALYGGRGYAGEANAQIACVVMIETRRALDNLEAIVTTPGVDAVYVGPSDLSLALGQAPAGDSDDAEHVATVERILAACRAHGVAAGIHTGSAEFAQCWLDAGFQMVTLGTDGGFMARAARADLRALTGGAGAGGGSAERTGY